MWLQASSVETSADIVVNAGTVSMMPLVDQGWSALEKKYPTAVSKYRSFLPSFTFCHMNFLKFMFRYGRWIGRVWSIAENVVTNVVYYRNDGIDANWKDFLAKTENELARYESKPS